MPGQAQHPSGLTRRERRRLLRARNTPHAVRLNSGFTPGSYVLANQARLYASISATTMRRLMASGQVKAERLGRDWWVELASLEAYLLRRAANATR